MKELILKKKRAKVINTEEGKIGIYEFKLKNNDTVIRFIKTPGLELDKKDEKIYDELENVLKKYSYINAICIICQGYFVRLDGEKILLFSRIIDFFGENFYKNFLFIMAYSDSEPHIEGLKLFNKNKKPFIQTYLTDPWFFNFDLASTFSEEKDDFTKDKFEEDCKMCEKFLEKVTKLSFRPFISKPKIDQSVLKKNILKFSIFYFEKKFFEIYGLREILEQTNQMKNIYIKKHNNWDYLSKKEMTEITYTITNLGLGISSKPNLLCRSCECTCFYNYLENEKCFFCPDSCKHFIDKKEYKIEISKQYMNFQDLFSNFKTNNYNELSNIISNHIKDLREQLLKKFNEMRNTIESNNLKLDYPLKDFISDIQKSFSSNDHYLEYKKNEIKELFNLFKKYSKI